MKNIGILAADSLIAFASLKKLSIERIDTLFFDNMNDTDLIAKNFLIELKNIVNAGEKIIPCVNGKCCNLEHVLFTEENEDVYKKILKLFGKEWIANFYDLNPSFELSSIYSLEDSFFDFLRKNCQAHSISADYLVADIEADEYEKRDSKWFEQISTASLYWSLLTYILVARIHKS